MDKEYKFDLLPLCYIHQKATLESTKKIDDNIKKKVKEKKIYRFFLAAGAGGILQCPQPFGLNNITIPPTTINTATHEIHPDKSTHNGQ